MRFPKSLVFWLTAKQEVLDQRISDRVDEMVRRGLLDEIRNFYENHVIKYETEKLNELEPGEKNKCIEKTKNVDDNTESNEIEKIEKTNSTNESTDNMLLKSYEEGLFQAIGFKEFHSYLTYQGDDEEEREKLLQLSLTKLKQITSKYSKKQVRWVQNRFLGRPKKNALDVYNLDASDIEKWDVNVLEKAVQISLRFMKDEAVPFEPYRVEIDGENQSDIDKNRKHVCKVCNDRIIIGDNAWDVHLKSKRHRKMKASKKAREG